MSFCDHMKDLRHFCLDSLIMVHGVLSCFSSLGNVLPLSLNAYIRFCGLCLLCLMRIVYIVFRPVFESGRVGQDNSSIKCDF